MLVSSPFPTFRFRSRSWPWLGSPSNLFRLFWAWAAVMRHEFCCLTIANRSVKTLVVWAGMGDPDRGRDGDIIREVDRLRFFFLPLGLQCSPMFVHLAIFLDLLLTATSAKFRFSHAPDVLPDTFRPITVCNYELLRRPGPNWQ